MGINVVVRIVILAVDADSGNIVRRNNMSCRVFEYKTGTFRNEKRAAPPMKERKEKYENGD